LRGVARTFVRARVDPALQGRGNRRNMPAIEERVLLLVGSEDRTTPPRLSQALYAASPLPPARKILVVVPGADHTDVIEHQQAIAAYRRFLAAAFAEE
jgi:pimeloyl-ACP methyl ester carboxylesterase